MSSFLWHTIADIGANLLAITDEFKTSFSGSRYGYDYQLRNPNTVREQYSFFSGWTTSGIMMGDPSQARVLGMQDNDVGGLYEPISVSDTGSQRGYFIHGVCRDGSGTPTASATIYLYLTSTNVLVTIVSTDANGIYSAATPFVGQNHYIYANYGPDTLVGATVDTLQPVTSPW